MNLLIISKALCFESNFLYNKVNSPNFVSSEMNMWFKNLVSVQKFNHYNTVSVICWFFRYLRAIFSCCHFTASIQLFGSMLASVKESAENYLNINLSGKKCSGDTLGR